VVTSTGEGVAGIDNPPVYGQNFTEITLQTNFNPADFNSPVLDIHFAVHWRDESAQEIRYQLAHIDVDEVFFTSTHVDSIKVIDPVHKRNPPDSPIVVCYGRIPGNPEPVDYEYNAEFVGSTQKLLLDVGANIYLSDGKTFDSIDPQSFSLTMIAEGQGGARYHVDDFEKLQQRFGKTDQGFDFQLDNDWGDIVPTRRLQARDLAYLTFYTDFYYTDSTTDSITISSNTNMQTSKNEVQISPLLLLWGCLAKGSQILMADGSNQAIEDVRIGDTVQTDFQHHLAKVTNTWTNSSESEQVVEIKAGDSLLQLTPDHLVVIAEIGLVPAGQIQIGQHILNSAGAQILVDQIRVDNISKVYNLDLEPFEETVLDHAFFANDILVGDGLAQN
ncbi:MAG: hypothetical protein LBC43_05075, partial [Bifidobacteriaceae bacterium]|nr:hypothetical protein [Bifidobacteriaceae bacterium]